MAIGALSVLLQVLFVGNMSYLYGSIWKSTSRFHAFRVLFVDYDEGVIGHSVKQGYQQLQGQGFPTLIERDRRLYPSMEDVIGAVKDTSYWAAFVTTPNASNRLAGALEGGTMAQEYNASGALTYVWNEVRYPPFSDEMFSASFENLVVATRLAYNKLNGTAALDLLNKGDPAALQVLLNPVMASSVNIMPTTQQTKLFYNTVSMVMPILQQFFFLLILNGISHESQLYSKLPLRISGLVRVGLSVLFDFLASLCMSGYIWAFRETWEVTGKQFALTWMVLWLLMHIHFLIIDASTAVLPLPALPFFLLTWIIINITSSISPFEASPGFYKWGYALPTNEAYTILTDIWSFGNVPQLYRAMPVLFSWWVASFSLAAWGHYNRCKKAMEQDEKLNNLAHIAPERSQQGTPDDSAFQPLRTTPSETLLEAAQVYRSAYGPSVPLPGGLWGAFESSEQDGPDSAKQTASEWHRLPGDPASASTDDGI
ncbi:hypothetical protein LTR91_025263 [Friedmanniomyces endolithicus]|uniref:DUF3533 domain-containing protein n=1 Tax=Friedmanniomyces endolithicus TaxID=329885 RepID=A0AAN6H2N7_9PEZI|nr:hypothetical protein LTR57_025118 [Friedmanniomyces endolithicus]KAK0951007.1 hypothetical protein LTR91_025263 [Friedmanniomyces endolithicus]KAK0951806.1 hypothetical protein LTS01_025098 [Friedmanniomyces endolithicus]KAK1021657.1 hypothetical protein LTS16_026354 [Friedmanniomyces endolithicus]